MPKSDPIDIMLAHNEWATRNVLEACAKLTPEQFHKTFEIGPGTLHNATLHIVGAMRTWTQTLAGQQPAPRIDQDGKQRTPAEILLLLENVSKDLAAEAHRLAYSETATRTRDGKTIKLTRGAILTHVLTHGYHHRTQSLNMLRQLGVKPLPPISVTEWAIMADSAG